MLPTLFRTTDKSRRKICSLGFFTAISRRSFALSRWAINALHGAAPSRYRAYGSATYPRRAQGPGLYVKQKKTGTELLIPVGPELQRVLDATPRQNLSFLTTTFGQPFTAAGFGGWFRERCDDAGLRKECSAHGLRKAACRRLAEAGCSASQIAAISGHKTLREVQRYVEAADKTRLARSGMDAVRLAFPGTKTGSDNGNS
jgi:integrase